MMNKKNEPERGKIMTIGEKIKKARKEQFLSQEALAQELGVSVQAVSKWECGVNFPDILNLPQIADYLSISLDELLRDNFEGEREVVSQGLPDDGKLRILAAVGQKVILQADKEETINISELTIHLSDVSLEEKQIELHVVGNAEIMGTVDGSVMAGNNVHVDGNVDGSITAGNNVTVNGNVDGSATAGNNVSVNGNVDGSVNAGNDVKHIKYDE